MHNKGSVSVLNSSRVTRAPFIQTTPRLLTLATGSHALLSSPDPHASLPSPLATLPSSPPLTPTPPYPRHWPPRLTFLTETPRLLTFATGPHALLWITSYPSLFFASAQDTRRETGEVEQVSVSKQ
ncbi:hypothetical protein Pcinc_044348, partial [Petrolisthes cinctipes]